MDEASRHEALKLALYHCCNQSINSPGTSTYLVWLLMLQKHMQKPITYSSLFLLRLVTKVLTQALTPHTVVSLAWHAYSPFPLPAAPDQMHWVSALENYCCALLLQGVLSSEGPSGAAVLTGRTFLTVSRPCAIFRSPSPCRWLEVASGGRERPMLCKCLRAGTTPGDRRLMASELCCLQFKWWSWQTPPQTNRVGVPFCG